MAKADAPVPTAQSPSKPMVIIFQDGNKNPELNTARSFPRFLQLPLELQIDIWKYTLGAPRVEPRVVRVTYNEKIDSFSYSFTIPPLLEVCQVSRKIAQHFYPSLVPDSAFPIYINPGIDFLYCRSPHLNPNPPMFGPRQATPVLPFVDTAANVANIRHLVLDDTYWKYRYFAYGSSRTGSSSIEEMKRFQSIEELFIVGMALEQCLERRKNLLELASYPNPPDERRLKDHVYAAEIARLKTLPNSAVPGFCVDPEDSEIGRCRRAELKKCFGVQKLPTGLIWHPYFYYATTFLPSLNDELIVDKTYWSKMPKLTIISEVLSEEPSRFRSMEPFLI